MASSALFLSVECQMKKQVARSVYAAGGEECISKSLEFFFSFALRAWPREDDMWDEDVGAVSFMHLNSCTSIES